MITLSKAFRTPIEPFIYNPICPVQPRISPMEAKPPCKLRLINGEVRAKAAEIELEAAKLVKATSPTGSL